jgi:hypothetical protein
MVLWIFIGCQIFIAQNPKKNLPIFNPTFNNKNVEILRKYINKVCTKAYRVSNDVKVNLYFLHSMECFDEKLTFFVF